MRRRNMRSSSSGREGLGDVVVGTEFHGLHGGFDGAMAGHDGDFAAGKPLLDFSRNSRPDICGITRSVRIMCAGCSSSRASAASPVFGFHASEAHGFGDGHAKAANACFVVHHQETNSEMIRSLRLPHSFFDYRHKLLNYERFFDAGGSGALQGRRYLRWRCRQ